MPEAAVSPRVLVTGFEPFPGAPVNPTERLARSLAKTPPAIAGVAAFRAEVLPVDYAGLGPRLIEIGSAFSPDIAIHFGLASECRGFRLERVARNRLDPSRFDNAGTAPPAAAICAGPDRIASTLPLAAIEAALTARGLPVEWSDDAGGYLCNMVFMLSLAHACAGFAPRMSGFIHVPPTGAKPAAPICDDDLLAGAAAIIAACLDAWKAGA